MQIAIIKYSEHILSFLKNISILLTHKLLGQNQNVIKFTHISFGFVSKLHTMPDMCLFATITSSNQESLPSVDVANMKLMFNHQHEINIVANLKTVTHKNIKIENMFVCVYAW